MEYKDAFFFMYNLFDIDPKMELVNQLAMSVL